MQKTKKPLEERASNLLNYCLQNNDWNPNYATTAVCSFVEGAYDDLEAVWHIETVIDILYLLLDMYRKKLSGTNLPVSKEYASSFTQLFRDTLMSNVAEHWLIIPIHRAKMSGIIEFGNYLFIPDDIPRERKLRMLADRSEISMEDMVWRADHTENSRSPNFYDYSLMCRRINHQTSFVYSICNQMTLLDFAILRVLKYANELEVRSPFPFISIEEYQRAENRHLVVNAQSSNSWGHSPIWADIQTTTFLDDLDWLNDEKVQSKMQGLESSIGYLKQKEIDALSSRFRRAALFFNKAVTYKQVLGTGTEGVGLELLHLMIAAECLLLDRESEKRLRLATLISRLVNIENHSSQEIFESFDECYRWRSDYVHSGEDKFPRYNDDLKEGQVKKKVSLVQHSVAQVIRDAPHYIGKSKQDVQNESPKASEKAWFEFLDSMWRSILSG